MKKGVAYTRKIDWQFATNGEKREFMALMPADMIDALTEFKNVFDAKVIEIEIKITVDE